MADQNLAGAEVSAGASRRTLLVPIQQIARYHGQVQGVGFRYTARTVAFGFAVTGTVRNCPDGSVELIAEGETAEVKAFLAELQRRMGAFIRRVELQQAPASGIHQEFSIRH